MPYVRCASCTATFSVPVDAIKGKLLCPHCNTRQTWSGELADFPPAPAPAVPGGAKPYGAVPSIASTMASIAGVFMIILSALAVIVGVANVNRYDSGSVLLGFAVGFGFFAQACILFCLSDMTRSLRILIWLTRKE